MLQLASLVLAASAALGQVEGAAAETPEYDPALKPIAWMIGDWVSEQKTATGEPKLTVKSTCKWAVNGKAILEELTATKPDGTFAWSLAGIYFRDPVRNRIAFHHVSTFGLLEGMLIQEDDTGLLFEERIVWKGGNQAYFKLKIGRKPDEMDSYTLGWTKISGAGFEEDGPHEVKRVK